MTFDIREGKTTISVAWDEVKELVVKLTQQLKDERITQIFGLPRGGTLLAVLCSHELRKPIIFDEKLIDNTTLVVDDVISSGNTFCKLLSDNDAFGLLLFLSEGAVPSLLQLEKLKVGKKKTSDSWLIFPWERTLQSQ